ncbi:MAG: hypothetical protein E6Q67_12950 [Roseateles sp.]|nr:MAG: hypothetical protein E6Q67_12950 [Roseateles sp.]
MKIFITDEHNQFRLVGTLAHLDTGSGKAAVEIYDGDMPEQGEPTGNLLVSIPLTKPAGTLVGGKLALTAESIPLVLRSGQASCGVVRTAAGHLSMVGDVSAASETDEAMMGAIKLDKVDLLAGGSVQLVSALIG